MRRYYDVGDGLLVDFVDPTTRLTGLDFVRIHNSTDPLTVCQLAVGSTFDRVIGTQRTAVRAGKPIQVTEWRYTRFKVCHGGEGHPTYFRLIENRSLGSDEIQWAETVKKLAEDMKHAAENATADVRTEASDNTQATGSAVAVSN